MKRDKFLLLVTNLNALDGAVSYIEKETLLKKDFKDYRVRFFHGLFQSKSGTLNRILKEEKHNEMNVVFQRNVPIKKVMKLMDRINEISEVENIIYSTRWI